MISSKLRVAACHVSPVFLSARETTHKCISLIKQAGGNGANLVVFPESYIPAFPVWSAILPPTHNHDLFQRMAQESVFADGEEILAIRNVAKQTKTIVSVGISEKVRYSSATLFNSNLIIGSNGEVVVHHRKLMPTFFEKLTWSPGDGHGLQVAETEFGKIGALICGENTNPLARYSMIAQGEQVHISTWPAIWPTRVPKPSYSSEDSLKGGLQHSPSEGKTAGPNERPNYDNVAANRTRAAAHCFEGKCFGVLCASHIDEANIAALSSSCSEPDKVRDILGQSPRAPSMFLDPTGTLLPGLTIDPETAEKQKVEFLQDEGIIYADMDLNECVEGKQYHDVAGGYQRLDVFDLKVNRIRRQPVVFSDRSMKAPFD